MTCLRPVTSIVIVSGVVCWFNALTRRQSEGSIQFPSVVLILIVTDAMKILFVTDINLLSCI